MSGLAASTDNVAPGCTLSMRGPCLPHTGLPLLTNRETPAPVALVPRTLRSPWPHSPLTFSLVESDGG